ncbi:hypothetical protein ACPEIF_14875 [Streptomyces sp. NPDC012600]|uniref:Phosphoadenosine phosphosulfate reductase n=2 Tax=Streptomyces TaxID=1883 RepID=A0ABU2W8R4_9ACTN|nr:hypothetical protein [Streptomyces griseus]MDT0494009.1 hypothetical protein [Streptomyces griseus]
MLIASARGLLPRLDAAIFADTGWEPRAVYAHLDRLERDIAEPAGIPVRRVSSGNIRADALDASHRFASMPLFIRNPDGGDGMLRRQCTNEYKLKPIKRAVRDMLGYPGRTYIPRGVYAEQWIGISTDEIGRARDSGLKFSRNVFPLLDLGWSRDDCREYLTAEGFGTTPKSACIGCPYHGNAQWRALRDGAPDEWKDAVDFDASIRSGNARATANGVPLLGQAFLHRSRKPLDKAPIDHVTRNERAAELGDPDGCSPYGCRSGEAVE